MAVEKHEKRKKVSKKSKKSWRKHTNIADVEEHLEEVRHEERTGGPVCEKPDEGLFFVDKETKGAGEENKTEHKSQRTRKRKLLKSDELLLPDTNVKPVGSKKRKRNKKLVKKPSDGNSSSGDEDDVKSVAAPIVPEKSTKDNRAEFDLWTSEKEAKEENLYLSSTKKKKVKMPDTLVGRTPSKLAAVEVCSAGASYNPDFDDHQSLLKGAVSVEETKAKNLEKLQKKMRFLTPEEAQALPTWQEEMSQGLFGDTEKDQNEAESSGSEDGGGGVDVRLARADYRKTKKERRKEAETKDELRKAQLEKEHKSREQEIFRLKTLKKEIKDADAKANERKKRKEGKIEQNADKPKRLSRHKYEAPNMEVQLSEELTGNLRALKQEGNLFEDRFKSLQRRNLLEPRKPVVPHRKYKRKEYEKKTSKKPCIKEI